MSDDHQVEGSAHSLQRGVTVQHGIVSWFDPQRGVGSIDVDRRGPAAVRSADIDGGGWQSLRVGDRVIFDLIEHPHAARAARVWVP